jgi:hypothetical protein
MFEIIAIILLSEKISTMARVKGYPNTGRFVLLFVSSWFGFEIFGAITGSIISSDFFVLLTFGYVFAIIGAIISFAIVHSLKTKEILSDYDPNIQIGIPFVIKLWKENIISIIAICIFCAILIGLVSYYFFILPILILLFTKYGIYKIVFQSDEIILQYFYGRKKFISKSQIVNAVLNKKLTIEVHWKKSSKHSTKSIKFSSTAFLVKKIPIGNINSLPVRTK